MIDLKLTEIFGVLGVGLFVVISIIYFYFLAQRLFNIRKHNRGAFFTWLKKTLSIDYTDTGYAIISGLLVYSCGLLTQDITDHMTDSERNFNPLISFVKNVHLLDTEGQLRQKVLIESKNELTGLGREVFSNIQAILHTDSQQFNTSYFNTNEPVTDFWKREGPQILSEKQSREKLIGLVNGLYYTSKNWCYLKEAPIKKELDEIQERVDFSRSICIVSFLDTIFLFFIYCFYFIKEFSKKTQNRFKVIITRPATDPGNISNRIDRKIKKRVFQPWRALLILTLIILISRECYTAAEKNFNERAMGYYVSTLKFNKSR